MARSVRYCAVFKMFRTPFLERKCRVHINSQDTIFRNHLERYISEYEYSLGALKIYGNHELEDDEEILSETFGETTFWRFGWYKVRENVDSKKTSKLGVTSSTIFSRGYEAIERYVRNQVQHVHEIEAFAALQRFYSNKEVHERCLRKLRHTMSEAHLVSIFSHHLLSQLLPVPSNYFIDSIHAKSNTCPCGCGAVLNYGSTQLGSPHLFYGFADVVLVPTNRNLFKDTDYDKSALFTVKRKMDEIYTRRLMFRDGTNISDFDDDEDILTEEFKCETKLIDEKRLCKQAISSSLCKYRKHMESGNLESGCSVPVCGVTRDSYHVTIYNPEYDFLLKTNQPLNLFEDDGQSLKFSAMVDLWLLIYHTLFISQTPLSVAYQLEGTANLIPQLGKTRFENVVNNSTWLYLPRLHRHSPSRVSKDVIKFAD